MALTMGSPFLASDLNTLKNRILSICRKRSNDENQGGNIYNNTAIPIPTIEQVNANNNFTAEYMNKIISKLYYFNTFTDNTRVNEIYRDGKVVANTDLIYAINVFSSILTAIEAEPRRNNNDCNTGCRGLCTNSCNDKCTGCQGCTSCTGSCKGSCDGCSGTCSSCTGSCSGGCVNSCHGDCTRDCYGASMNWDTPGM